jgi:hypothetical protein
VPIPRENHSLDLKWANRKRERGNHVYEGIFMTKSYNFTSMLATRKGRQLSVKYLLRVDQYNTHKCRLQICVIEYTMVNAKYKLCITKC